MKKYVELTENRKLTKMQKVQAGAVLGVIVVAYVVHRRKLDAVITVLAENTKNLVETTGWEAFDEGVRYGLNLAKEGVKTAEVGQYTFGAFDKTNNG